MTHRTLLFFLFQYATTCLAQVHLGPGQPYPNIQAAVAANAIQPGDTVFCTVAPMRAIRDLPTGVYYLNVEHVFYPFVKL